MTAFIELFLPGLVGVPGRLLESLAPEPANAVLADTLKRSDALQLPSGRYAPLAGWLGCARPPIAALQAYACGRNQGSGLLLATPTHLQAGMDDLVMMPPELIEMTAAERTSLAQSLREYFDESPELVVKGDSWFLDAGHLDINTVPLHDAIGCSVRPNLPQGADATRVHAWMNEMQMALHAAAANHEREIQGQPPVNGVWLWGEGELPESPPESLRQSGFAGRPGRLDIAAGFANWLSAPHSTELPASDNCFVVDATVSDALDAERFERWRTLRDEAVTRWLEPALQRLREGSVDEIRLYPGDGRQHRLARGDLKKFWRGWRSKPAATSAESRNDEESL
ncbi:MAG: hypothetical protein R3270_01665 [Gammaproteobacteria bacterium]|nr:hypothetical protein [Gammaproteobacteria bacterium]